MNTPSISRKAIIPIMASALIYTSCIIDAPGDKFLKTMWESDEVPLGPFPIEELSIEFLSENGIILSLDNGAIVCNGTYDSNDIIAVFHNLSAKLEGRTITFIDAQLSGKTLFLRWRVENSVYPFTTAMHQPTLQK
jgi:hypothetical protein